MQTKERKSHSGVVIMQDASAHPFALSRSKVKHKTNGSVIYGQGYLAHSVILRTRFASP
jgi:hypothetical protein